jgi:hypothetical protein
MLKSGNIYRLFTCLILLCTLLLLNIYAVEKKVKKRVVLPKGTPILWQHPDDIESRNLYLGPGGSSMKPDLRRVTFIEEVKGGWSKKFRVRDASGREWVAKLSSEAQSETAANRLLWAVGYPSEIVYLVPRVNIRGKGVFENVRFEARPKNVKRLTEWQWESNPFIGTRELQGLKVLMVMLNNWDIKDENNKILYIPGSSGSGELRYIVSDLGATFGKTGRWPSQYTRSRNKPEDYINTKFVEQVENNLVKFSFNGKRKELFKDITTEDAYWIGSLLSRLSDSQLRDAFRAANYNPEQINMLTKAVRSKINELVGISANPVSKRN